MKRYRPEELFDADGRFKPELAELAPKGHRRMSDNPHANGGLLLRELKMPDFRDYAVEVPTPGATSAESTRLMGKILRDVMQQNLESRNFRLFSPDENNSNRWQDVLEVTNRCYVAEILPEDDHLAPDGRVIEVLSEHQCQGWLEGRPHGLSEHEFDALFTSDKPIIFAFHGYPWLIHRLTYRRNGHKNLHVRGYKEEGTTTTPFDMVVLNELDRFSLVNDVIDRVPQLASRAAYAKQAIRDTLLEHKQYIAKYGDDMPEIAGWKWKQKASVTKHGTSTEGDNV